MCFILKYFLLGETVQSVRDLQKIIDYKKSLIPQVHEMYSNEIYKKTLIPQAAKSIPAAVKSIPAPVVEKSNVHKTEKKSKLKDSKKKSKVTTKKSKKKKKADIKRQFVAQNQQYYPAVNNYQQQNPFSMQQSALQQSAYVPPQPDQSAAQVQNMDGFYARPIITGK